MSPRLLDPLFYLGLVLVTMGTLFKIQHWPYGRLGQTIGLTLEALFFVLVVIEIASSKKASNGFKTAYISIYLILPIIAYLYLPAVILIFALFILGSVYLRGVRKKVLFMRGEMG